MLTLLTRRGATIGEDRGEQSPRNRGSIPRASTDKAYAHSGIALQKQVVASDQKEQRADNQGKAYLLGQNNQPNHLSLEVKGGSRHSPQVERKTIMPTCEQRNYPYGAKMYILARREFVVKFGLYHWKAFYNDVIKAMPFDQEDGFMHICFRIWDEIAHMENTEVSPDVP